MFNGKKVVVVMPAYNAAKTLERTTGEIDRQLVDEIVLVDDCSRDETVTVANSLGLHTVRHEKNLGYGGNQKTCYREALKLGAEIIIMVHPDYQYTPKLIPAMAALLSSDLYDIVLASRILGGKALEGGMPFYKYVSNRILTLVENWLTGMKLSEYHTGYRAYTNHALRSILLEQNSNDFIFDNQILVQAHHAGLRIAEITCPTKYFAEASSINFFRSLRYGFGCLGVGLLYQLDKWGIYRSALFNRNHFPPLIQVYVQE
jgi:glycosyltransferase involved in cell wall biosynthesis